MAHFRDIIGDIIEYQDGSDDDFEVLANAVIEDEQLAMQARHRGSVLGHKILCRDRVRGHERLYHDYFAENCVYPDHLFRRRFRMIRHLFCRIKNDVEAYDSYFIQKRDAVGVVGLSSLQKITAAFRMLAYGALADSMDDYLRIGESTSIESLRKFVKAVVAVFGNEYLRSPNNNDIVRLLALGEKRGFPGMLGSIDCMHWKWKNCPTTWHGMYTGHIHEPTIVLEAVASQDLWIWHAFFGMPGSLNDINVLDRSPIFAALAEGHAPPVSYKINGHSYSMGYYLADGIYPTWSTFVKTIPCPQGLKKQNFAKEQESARKDVERAFGVLQARFAIIRGPARFWDEETLADIMKACIIMHNMIIEDEGDASDFDFDGSEASEHASVSHELTTELVDFIQTHRQIRSVETHSQLQSNLVEHLWQRYGQE